MKTLFITRHAKSDWKTDAQTDFDRPLNSRGIRDVPVMASRLLDRGRKPQLIVASTAVRTMKTAQLLLHACDLRTDQLQSTRTIYEAPLQALVDCVISLPDQQEAVMLVCHNPGASSLCNHLCVDSNVQMPTCAMACLDLEVDRWQDAYRDCASLRWYDYPKNNAN